MHSSASWVHVEDPSISHLYADDEASATSSSAVSFLRRWRRLPTLQRNFFVVLFLLIGSVLIYAQFGPEPRPRFDDRMPRPRGYEDAQLNREGHLEIDERRIISANPDANEPPEEVPIEDQKVKQARRPNKMSMRDQFTGPKNADQQRVVDTMQHAWSAYKRHAWGADHLRPVSKSGEEWFKLALTIVDSLDTLFIMGLHKEFDEGVDYVLNKLNVSPNSYVNFFEVTIRVLGGLLSAYHLSGDGRLLEKAEELGIGLSAAFDSPSAVPYSDVNLQQRRGKAPAWTADSSLSEVTTVQLEFRDLSRQSGNPVYERLAANTSWHVHSLGCPDRQGLCPMFISAKTGKWRPTKSVTMGARTDSYYEYLLKQYLQTGRKHQWMLDDYVAAIDSMHRLLYKYTEPHKIAFIGELDLRGKFYAKMDHLLCFIAGTLAMGHHLLDLPAIHMETAKRVGYVCRQMYNVTKTGLGPELVHFNTAPLVGGNEDIWIKPADAHCLLRPEAIEGWWYLYRFTRDEQYRQWGSDALAAIDKYAKIADGGYSSVANVNKLPVEYRDKQESFFLAETLKYLYLLFDDKQEMFPLDKWVFNTEAHPLPVYED